VSLKQLMSMPLKQLVFRKSSLLASLAALAAFLVISGVGHDDANTRAAANTGESQVTVAVVNRAQLDGEEFVAQAQKAASVSVANALGGGAQPLKDAAPIKAARTP